MSTEEEKESNIDDIDIQNLYYGFNPVYFKACEGKTFVFDDKMHSFKAKTDLASIQIVKERRLPQHKLGNEYAHLLLPSMPCVDIDIETNEEEKKTNAYSDESVEEQNALIMISTLIKTKATDASINKSIIAYQSGIRSALICDNTKDKNTWYRLKGCGNNNDGYFPFQCIEKGRSPLIEIRGSCFEHTTFRELKMTFDICDILNKHQLPNANISYGWYLYDVDKYCKEIKRTCTVFKTIGNKRFGDHLMVGLLKILPLIIDIDAISMDNIFNLFPETRQMNENDAENKWKVMETYLAVLCEIDTINLLKANEIMIPLKKRIEIDTNMHNNKRQQSLWNYECRKYNEFMCEYKGDTKRIIIEIYSILGFESGFIQRLLHKNNISWGTYNDALGTHCNAHCNNYIILPYHEFKKYKFCLAPLDFDMAFYEKEYIQNMDTKHAQYTFKELITMETNGNRASLSGDPQISTGVHWNINENKNNKMDLMHWALNDTLISCFDAAYNADDDTRIKFGDGMNENKQKLMYSIFNLALIHTLDIVA